LPSVRELFTIEYGQSLSLNKLHSTSPGAGVAFVSRTARNNGIAAWVEEVPGVSALPAGLLTVCLRSRNHALATFLQPHRFYCGYHIYVLQPIDVMSAQEKLWWAECIAENRYRYNFGRQANRSLADLQLPDEVPSWVNELPIPEFKTTQVAAPIKDPRSDSWGHFRIGSLFEVVGGRSVLKRNMRPGPTPYVSAVAVNNGVSAWIDAPADHDAGCITVASNGNGGVGCAFYQPTPFIASADVTILKPSIPLTEAAALFVCTIIYAERYRWNYWRKWTTSRIRDSLIQLPSDSGGSPDWNYADSYIRQFPLAGAVLG
jgi:Type I restriction modification DNA specificity domain